MAENTMYVNEAESVSRSENRAEKVLRNMFSSLLFLMCAVLTTLNAVFSAVVSGMNGSGDIYGGAVTFASWAFQVIFTGKGYTGIPEYPVLSAVLSGVFGTVTAVPFWLVYIGAKKQKLCGAGLKTMKVALLCRAAAFAVTAIALFSIVIEFIVYAVTMEPNPHMDELDYFFGYAGYGIMFIEGIVSVLSAVCRFSMVRVLGNSEKAVRGENELRAIPSFVTCMYSFFVTVKALAMAAATLAVVLSLINGGTGNLWVVLLLACKTAQSALFAACILKFNKIAGKAKA